MLVLKAILMTMALTTAVYCDPAESLCDTDLLLNNPLFQLLMVQVNDLNAQVKLNQHRISDLEALDKIHQSRIKELESRNQDQEQRINNLDGVVSKQQQEIKEMQLATVDTFQTAPESNEAVDGHDDDIDTDKPSATNDNANRIRRQLPEVDVVAFTVILVHSQTDLGLNQSVHFDLIETNIGNAYNQHHGVFVAPIAGTYVFHISVLAQYNTEAWCKIVVNGINKVDSYAHGYASYSDQGSQMLVVHLNQGDEVAVQNGRAHNTVSGNDNRWTTFSGFLLHADTNVVDIVG